MKTTIRLLCIGWCLMLVAPRSEAASICNAISGNLVSNCGFETGDFTGWTLSGNDVPGQLGNLYGVEGADPFPMPTGTAPHSGSYQAFFADLVSNATTLALTLATVSGHDYTVSFWLSQQLVGPGTVTTALSSILGVRPSQPFLTWVSKPIRYTHLPRMRRPPPRH